MTQRLRQIRGAGWAVALGLGLMQAGWAQAPGQSGAPAAGPPASAPPPQAATAAPQTAASGAVLRTGSTLVLVPALVKTKHGEPVFTLTADSFVVTDDGVEQKVRLEEDSGGQPLALVIVVETGGAGARFLDDYRNLEPMVEAVVGNVQHKVAVVGFDSEPQILQPFTSHLERVGTALSQIEAGDDGAAILDSLGYAVDQLRRQPAGYRRAILLLSETVDQGSHLKIEDALRQLSDTNTSIYSLAFSSSKTEAKHEAAGIASDPNPGPAGGCMAKPDGEQDAGQDAGHDTGKTPPNDNRLKQAWNCAGVLLPPLRLANLAFMVGMNGLRKNVPETVAQLSGGEYFSFKDTRGVERAMMSLSNHIPNRYVLSFEPQSPHPGIHAISLRLKDYTDLVVTARSSYWAENQDDTQVTH
jgi:VWFA-related protein